MGWLGLDDTDGLGGGCTTHTMHRIITALENECSENDWVVSPRPSLVRLWPFARRRTRGNAAVAVEITCNSESSRLTLCARLDELWNEIVVPDFERNGTAITSEHSEREQSDASPAMLWSPTRPDKEWYWRCVKGEVELADCEAVIPPGSRLWQCAGGHGLIGALAAVSWLGEHDHTWEVTCYRIDENISIKRRIPESRCVILDEKFPETILNRDPTISKSLIAPRTPCPVLFGVRAEDGDAAIGAAKWIFESADCEPISGWQLWKTNQATDDHITTISKSIVTSPVSVKKHGHAAFTTDCGTDIVAFSQGGEVNRMAQSLRQGDEIEYSGLCAPDGSTHVEKMRLMSYSDKRRRRPLCNCGKRMKSMGNGQGIRCPACGERRPKSWDDELAIESPFTLGQWVEPSASNRRHLAAPLGRRGGQYSKTKHGNYEMLGNHG